MTKGLPCAFWSSLGAIALSPSVNEEEAGAYFYPESAAGQILTSFTAKGNRGVLKKNGKQKNQRDGLKRTKVS